MLVFSLRSYLAFSLWFQSTHCHKKIKIKTTWQISPSVVQKTMFSLTTIKTWSVYCSHKVLMCWVQGNFCSPHRKEKSLCVPSHCLLNFTHCIFNPDSISLVTRLERPGCVMQSLTVMNGAEDHLFVQWRQGKLAQSGISFLMCPARLSPSVPHTEPDCWQRLA